MMAKDDIGYGASQHYQGERGRAYLDWQATGGDLRGQLNRFKFVHYIRSEDTVLDFGCSDGALLAALPGAHKIGVEINPLALARATVRGFVGYPSLADVADTAVDLIISNHALEHVPNPYGALLEMRRVLKPDGRLVLCVPADDWRHAPRWTPGDINHHLYAWTPLTLGNLLQEAGFQVTSVTLLSHAWPPRYPWLFRVLPRPLFDLACRVWSVVRRQRQILAIAQVIKG